MWNQFLHFLIYYLLQEFHSLLRVCLFRSGNVISLNPNEFLREATQGIAIIHEVGVSDLPSRQIFT